MRTWTPLRLGSLFICTVSVIIAIYAQSFEGESNSRTYPSWDCSSTDSDLVIWRHRIGSDVGAISVADGRVLFGSISTEANRNGLFSCLNRADGNVIWSAQHARLPHPVNDNPASGIRSHAQVDGNRLYYVSNRGEVICLDVDGFHDNENDGPYQDEPEIGKDSADVVWRLDMVSDLAVFKRDASEFGNPIASPLVVDDLVICVTGNGSILGYEHAFPKSAFVPHPDAPSLIALDKRTGAIQWKFNYPGKRIAYGQWASPVVARAREGKQVLFPGGDGILYSLEPRTGHLLWKYDCEEHDRRYLEGRGITTHAGFIATPVVSGDAVFVVRNLGIEADDGKTQYGLHSVDLGLGARPNGMTNWIFSNANYRGAVTSPLIVGGQLLSMSISGRLFAISLGSGEETWNLELGNENLHFAGPFLNRERVYIPLDEKLVVIKPDAEKRILGVYRFGARVQGQPTISDGVLYLGTSREILAIDDTKAQSGN